MVAQAIMHVGEADMCAGTPSPFIGGRMPVARWGRRGTLTPMRGTWSAGAHVGFAADMHDGSRHHACVPA